MRPKPTDISVKNRTTTIFHFRFITLSPEHYVYVSRHRNQCITRIIWCSIGPRIRTCLTRTKGSLFGRSVEVSRRKLARFDDLDKKERHKKDQPTGRVAMINLVFFRVYAELIKKIVQGPHICTRKSTTVDLYTCRFVNSSSRQCVHKILPGVYIY